GCHGEEAKSHCRGYSGNGPAGILRHRPQEYRKRKHRSDGDAPQETTCSHDNPAIGYAHSTTRHVLSGANKSWSTLKCTDARGSVQPTTNPFLTGVSGSALCRFPVGRRNGIDHPGNSELIDERTEAGRPEGLAEGHDRLATIRQLLEPALALGLVPGV